MLNQAKQIEPITSEQPDNRMNVLVLDDSEVDRQRLLRLCREAGLNFVSAEVGSVAEMRAALDRQKFDLVFIDYSLVGEDGLDAIDLLASHPDSTTVSIMIAGEGRIDVAVEAMRRGCSDYLTKSGLSVEAVQKSVATGLERRMMGLAFEEERDKRLNLEAAVRRYADECSVEMRAILAAALRRVRKLRSYQLSDDYSQQLGALERSIDRMWEALPDFRRKTTDVIDGPRSPTLAVIAQPQAD